MNLAIAARGPARHPLGLSVVVALHVLLAAALLVANTLPRPTPPETAALLLPAPPDRPPAPQPQALPQPREPMLRRLVLPVPELVPEPAPPAAAPLAALSPVATASVGAPTAGPAEPPSAAAARTVARPASLDAGAADCRPDYPAAAQRAGATGITRLRFTIGASGVVTRAEILRSAGPTPEHRLLDRAAAQALQHCLVKVGLDEEGRPVGATTEVEYSWILH